jgi:uncharacterized protein (UPF0332 family)
MMPEQLALLQKAKDSLQAAQLLADQGFYDFAVSRAYYAMFYVAEAFLLGEGVTFSKHSAVIAAFGQRFARTGRVPSDFHRYLIEGQSGRNIGDYDFGAGLSAANADEQIARAQRFVDLAERLLGSHGDQTG